MTLTEAIEITTDFSQQESDLLGNEFSQAALLLIEAGRREITNRRFKAHIDHSLLPGETEE